MQRLYQVVQRLSGNIASSLKAEIAYESVDARTQRIHGRTGEMIALDCQPFSVAEDQGFRQ